MQRVILGNTGIEVSILAFGTGTSGWGGSSNQTRKHGVKGLADLLRFAYERGITFWDSADQYGSHRHCREALKSIPRENIVITTKTVARSAKEMRSDIERFRQELGTDYLDIVLLHCMISRDWNIRMRPVMDVLSEAKEKGIVHAVGCSNHDFGALCTAAKEPWVEVVLARINPAGLHMENTPEKVIPVLQQMKAKGKGVYGMKVMGQGELGRDPKRAIRYQIELREMGCVDAFVIGMESKEEVIQNTEIIEELTAVPV